ncbi:RNA polymerase factor sigma-54 [Paenibacillus doosanensis]|uniref:RNA polymerase sigma-54 factor 1 n=1 Tax=Paenibacillus konkukensis TaxID=2020716 RepID=A0ABY4RJE2_9BACL|nr:MULTISPECIES: RNA polymerase factor sigma-54 [Paenibacillus]MCS7463928.1 RNA polymerase factor sigma-54 [Paenibacillus doosanensis]UQZ82263.1 RNA polymerase sigma-54 factor 1 [Paenibacillus konkukensis]
MTSLSTALIQTQKLLLTPRLRQSIEMLHMSSLELMEFIQEQSRENPLLDYKYDSVPPSPGGKKRTSDPNHEWWLHIRSGGQPSLEAVLTEQLQEAGVRPELHKIALFIIRSLDEKGYLPLTPQWISQHLRQPVPLVLKAVDLVQNMEPAGVAASSLEECLMLQLDQLGDNDALVRSLIRGHLKDIAKRRFGPLAKQYGVEPADIQRAASRISRLNPKPGAAYSGERTQFIVPDIVLTRTDEGFEIGLHDASLPNIVFNAEYVELMKSNPPKEVSAYLTEQRKRVQAIIDSIEHRKATMYKVATVIFEHQHAFCLHGPSAIKPMAMRHVAELLGIHESTVSRAVNQKFAMTPWGLYELKQFFTSSVKQADGAAVSSAQIKEQLRELIDGEDKTEPWSDQKLAERLTQSGLQVSRRTVAKYRDQLNIPAALERKQYQ